MRARQVTAVSVLVAILVSFSAFHAAKAQGGGLSHCKDDAARICPGIAPGGGKLAECLKQHQDDVSIGCAKALKAIKTKMGK
jgi:Cysteine rich repeat